MRLQGNRRKDDSDSVCCAGGRLVQEIYDLRSTFASDALAAGVSVFELARIMGTSVGMIGRHYGAPRRGRGRDRRTPERSRRSARGATGERTGDAP